MRLWPPDRRWTVTHELGIISAVLDAVRESAAREGISHVTSVRLIVGRRHGALPDALRFAFEVLTSEAATSVTGAPDLFHGATLEIEERPIRARCRSCGFEYGESAASEPAAGDNAPDHPAGPSDAAARAAPDSGIYGWEAWALPCPRCGAPAPEILGGNELSVDSYEGE